MTSRPLTSALRIDVNETAIHFTLEHGSMRLTDDSGSEQCEGCGADIMETGAARLYHTLVDLVACRADGLGVVECRPCGARCAIRKVSR